MSTVDEEIKTHSRKWLVELNGCLSFKNLLALRDVLDAVADVITDQLKRMAKSKQKRLFQRPSEEIVRDFEAALLRYVNSDINPNERWSELKLWVEEILLPDLKRAVEEILTGREPSNRKESVYQMTKRRFSKSIRIFLRESPGRNSDPKKNERYAEASRIREELKWSYKKLAQELFPAEYANNPKNAASMVCQGIKRYRSKFKPKAA